MFKKLFSLLLILAPTLALSLFAFDAFAADEAFSGTMCNVYNIATGTGGKAFAAFAIISVGVGFYTGKISWGLMVGVTMGVATIFGAPSVVSAISGDSQFVCDRATYTTTCVNGVCSSCPAGTYGEYCCPAGFTGENCDECATGYTNSPACDTCADQYVMLNGFCVNNSCTSGSISGLAESVTVSMTDNSALPCNANVNITGTISYSCIDGNFAVLSNDCVCPPNFDPSNCSSCATGYSGEETGCVDCDSAAGYSMIDGACQKECSVSNKTGLSDRSGILPPSGTITCDVDPYSGILDYTCIDGVFSAPACTKCESPKVRRENGNCENGNSCVVTSNGMPSGQTVAHLASNVSINCKSGYVGSMNFSCYDASLTINSGACYQNCTVPTIAGVTATTATHSTSTDPRYLTCNASHYSNANSISYTCNNGTFNYTGTCGCATGYLGDGCSTCDTANGYIASGSNCVLGASCSLNVIPGASSAGSLLHSTTATTITCGATGYNGAQISRTCTNGTWSTGTACNATGCATGYMSSGTSCVTAASCTFSPTGTSPATATVAHGASGSLPCDTSASYSGGPATSSVCNNGGALTTTASCLAPCTFTPTGTSPASVKVVSGSTGTLACNTAAGYTAGNAVSSTCTNGSTLTTTTTCKKTCTYSGATGTTGSVTVNHGSTGTLTCNASNFDSTKSATSSTCNDGGTLTTQTACTTCASGYVLSGTSCVAFSCTGGTVTTSGSTKLHTFTSNGSFSCNGTASVNILVVGSGGSGGSHGSTSSDRHSTGGGGGGEVVMVTGTSLTSGATYNITVGGTTSGVSSSKGNNGAMSSVAQSGSSTIYIKAKGGGGGGGAGTAAGQGGGSGGGAHCSGSGGAKGNGGVAGFTGSITQYANTGGSAGACTQAGGGGGGAGDVGAVGNSNSGGTGGAGGAGVTFYSTNYGAGGGGCGATNSGAAGGSSAGGGCSGSVNATSNTGGGGGAVKSGTSGSGGSGVVIISYTSS